MIQVAIRSRCDDCSAQRRMPNAAACPDSTNVHTQASGGGGGGSGGAGGFAARLRVAAPASSSSFATQSRITLRGMAAVGGGTTGADDAGVTPEAGNGELGVQVARPCRIRFPMRPREGPWSARRAVDDESWCVAAEVEEDLCRTSKQMAAFTATGAAPQENVAVAAAWLQHNPNRQCPASSAHDKP